jgi:hypothetical protein
LPKVAFRAKRTYSIVWFAPFGAGGLMAYGIDQWRERQSAVPAPTRI